MMGNLFSALIVEAVQSLACSWSTGVINSSGSQLPIKPDVPTVRRSSSLEWLPPHMSDPRVDPLENSWSQRSSDLNIRPEDHERKLSINKQAIQK